MPAKAFTLSPENSVNLAITDDESKILAGQESQIIEFEKLINDLRAEHGLNPVEFNAKASVEAFKWSEWMSKAGQFRHTTDFEVDSESVKYYSRRNENIAISDLSSVGSMFAQWKTSDSHRAGMNDPNATSFGVGFYTAHGKTYGTALLHAAKSSGYMPETYHGASSYYSGGKPVNITNSNMVRVPAPTVNKTNNTYTIPSATGVRYYNVYKEEFILAGTYKIYGDRLHITPVMGSGYQSRDDNVIAKGGWSWRFNEFPYMDGYSPDEPRVVGKIVALPYDEYIDYYVNGALQDGYEYDASNFSNVKVTAKVNPEYSDWLYLDEYEDGWELSIGTQGVTASPVLVDNQSLSYKVPTAFGVQYMVNGSPRSAGTYKATVGSTFTFTVKPLRGYHVDKLNTFTFSHSFASMASTPTPPNLKNIRASAPSFNTTGMTYTIPSVPGITYKVNNAQVRAGTHKASYSTTYKVTAHANTGYSLTGTTSWSKNYGAEPVIAVTPAAPTTNVLEGKYTIPSTAGVNYYVGGVHKVSGTYSSGYRNIVVTAKARSSKYSLSGTTSWSLKLAKIFVSPKSPVADIAKKKLTVPTVRGVSYYVGGKLTKAGTHNIYSRISVTTRASAKNYDVKQKTWTFDYRTSVTPTAPKVKPSYITIPQRNGVKYYVNGSLRKKGTYKVSGSIRVTTAAASAHYKLNGTTTWSYRFVASKRPTSNAKQNTVTVPATSGAKYYISGKYVKPGIHKKYPGLHTVTVKPSNNNVYLSGTLSWKLDNRDPVTTKPVSGSSSRNTITISRITGVAYYIDGKYAKPGVHKNYSGRHSVSAKPANKSYKLRGKTSWKVDNRR